MNVNVRALIETKLATWLKKFLSSKPVVHVLVIDIKLRNEWDVSGLLEVLLRNTAQGFLYARTMILRYWNFTDPCGQEGKSLDQRTDAATGWYQIWGSQPSKAVFLLFFPLWCQLFEIPVGCFLCTWSISWMKCKKKCFCHEQTDAIFTNQLVIRWKLVFCMSPSRVYCCLIHVLAHFSITAGISYCLVLYFASL